MATVEIRGPFKINDQMGPYVIKPGRLDIALTGEVISDVAVSASSSDPCHPASRITDNSGMRDENGDGFIEHGIDTNDMWLSAKGQTRGRLEFDFGQPYKLSGIDVWNYNEQGATRRGIQRADISIWAEDKGWVEIRRNYEFDRATTGEAYNDPTFVDLEGATAAKVRFDNIKNFDDVNFTGLSEVRFYRSAGAQAARPVPADGALCDGDKITLAWMPGNGAKTHKLYLGTDAEKLEFVGETAGYGYMRAEPSGLSENTRYYWRVDEVNTKGNETTGKVWSFTIAGAQQNRQALAAVKKVKIKFLDVQKPAGRDETAAAEKTKRGPAIITIAIVMVVVLALIMTGRKAGRKSF